MQCPHPILNIWPDVLKWNVLCPPHLNPEHIISSVLSLAKVVYPSVALLAELVLINYEDGHTSYIIED